MSDYVSDAEVYFSWEYIQYSLILGEAEAYYYAREELAARRRREASTAPEQLPYKERYQQYLLSPEWQERADAAKLRFGRRCALCNSDQNLEAHHRTYERVYGEFPDDITALCADCHHAYHEWRRGKAP